MKALGGASPLGAPARLPAFTRDSQQAILGDAFSTPALPRRSSKKERRRQAELAAAHSRERIDDRMRGRDRGVRRPKVHAPKYGEVAAALPAPVVDLRALVLQRLASGSTLTAGARSSRRAVVQHPSPSDPRIAALATSIMERAERDERDRAATANTFADAQTRRLVEKSRTAAPLVLSQAEFPPSANSADLRELRARVRASIRHLMPRRSQLRKCGELRQPRSAVEVHVRHQHQHSTVVGGAPRVVYRGGVSGLVRCGSVAACPMCAPRVQSGRAAIVRAVVEAHRDATRTDDAPGGAVYMVTLTVRHDAGMRLAQLRRVVVTALQHMQRGKRWSAIKSGRYGLPLLAPTFTGSIAARETTVGEAGWHPHIHWLWSLDRPLLPNELARLRRLLYARWVRALQRAAKEHGLPTRGRLHASCTPSYARGVHIATATARGAGDYITKLGLSDELTRAVAKSGRAGNRSPFELMADFARTGDAGDALLLREYFVGVKGARQLTWSRGWSKAEREAAEREGRVCEPRRSLDLRLRYLPQLVASLGTAALPRELPDTYGDAWAAIAATVPAIAQLRIQSTREILEEEERTGALVAELPGRQWDAFVRVIRAARGNAEHELRTAAEQAGADGVRAVLAAAWHLGRRLRKRRQRQWLDKWLHWIAPPDDGDPAHRYTLTTIARQYA